MEGTCYITVNGENVRLHFGIPANKQFSVLSLDNDFFNDNELTENGIAALLFCGYTNGCMVEDKKPIYKKADFLIYVDDAIIGDQTELSEAVKCYFASKYTKALFEKTKEPEADTKKKKKKK